MITNIYITRNQAIKHLHELGEEHAVKKFECGGVELNNTDVRQCLMALLNIDKKFSAVTLTI